MASRRRKFRGTLRCIGITLQVIIYFCNAFAWAVSILALTCGFVIGIGNDTVRVSSLSDLGVTTPATLLVIYGSFLIIVATTGCFSSVTAGIIISIVYLVLILLFIIFDTVGGYAFLFSEESLVNFYINVNKSMNNYGETESNEIGIFPISTLRYWTHLQTRGKCCGLKSFEDWKPTRYSVKTYSVPDSCCNADYRHRYCGVQAFRHPDTPEHDVQSLVYQKGCIDIFPEALKLPPDGRIAVVTIILGVFLIICFILTCVIIILVVTKRFRPEQGIDNLDYMETRKASIKTLKDTDIEGIETGGDGEQGPRRRSLRTAKHVKVYPENDRRGSIEDKDNKRVFFRERGPQFIHDKYHSEPETSETNIRKSQESERRKVVSQGNDRPGVVVQEDEDFETVLLRQRTPRKKDRKQDKNNV